MTKTSRRTPAGLTILTAALLLTLLFISGAAQAAAITVENPAYPLTAGQPATLSVTLNNAEDIAGLQLYIKEDSSAEMHIKTDSAAIEGLYLNSRTNKAVLYPEDHAPLYGTVKLFDIEITPAAGENVQITFDIIEVIDSLNDDITTSCIGTPAVILVTDGTTLPPKQEPAEENTIDWIYDTTQQLTNEDQTDLPAQPEAQPVIPVYTTRPEPAKSPGFLPLTILSAITAGIAALALRQNRKGET